MQPAGDTSAARATMKMDARWAMFTAQAKVQAGTIVGLLAKDLGGKGGGRADLAQGGGSLPAGASLAEVIDRWTVRLRDYLAAVN